VLTISHFRAGLDQSKRARFLCIKSSEDSDKHHATVGWCVVSVLWFTQYTIVVIVVVVVVGVLTKSSQQNTTSHEAFIWPIAMWWMQRPFEQRPVLCALRPASS
jgi:hypothetical protein